jgi:hypothetical protein
VTPMLFFRSLRVPRPVSAFLHFEALISKEFVFVQHFLCCKQALETWFAITWQNLSMLKFDSV